MHTWLLYWSHGNFLFSLILVEVLGLPMSPFTPSLNFLLAAAAAGGRKEEGEGGGEGGEGGGEGGEGGGEGGVGEWRPLMASQANSSLTAHGWRSCNSVRCNWTSDTWSSSWTSADQILCIWSKTILLSPELGFGRFWCCAAGRQSARGEDRGASWTRVLRPERVEVVVVEGSSNSCHTRRPHVPCGGSWGACYRPHCHPPTGSWSALSETVAVTWVVEVVHKVVLGKMKWQADRVKRSSSSGATSRWSDHCHIVTTLHDQPCLPSLTIAPCTSVEWAPDSADTWDSSYV